jgi:hypothetical protein
VRQNDQNGVSVGDLVILIAHRDTHWVRQLLEAALFWVMESEQTIVEVRRNGAVLADLAVRSRSDGERLRSKFAELVRAMPQDELRSFDAVICYRTLEEALVLT